MIRRSRISVRPNVRPNANAAGRSGPQPVSQDAPEPQPSSQDAPGSLPTSQDAPGPQHSSQDAPGSLPTSQDAPGPQHSSQDAPGSLPTSQETPQLNQDAQCVEPQAETNKDNSVAVVSPLRKSTVPRDTSDAGGEGTSSSAALQRRKRFAIKPKVAPALNRARAPKSPVRTVVLESPVVEGPGADSQDVTASRQTDASLSQRTTSPSQQQQTLSGGLSGGDTRPTTPVAVPAEDEDSTEQAQVPLEKSQPLELSPSTQAKDVPPKPPDKPCPSDKEAMEMSERAKTLVSRSAKGGLPPPQAQFTLSRLLNDSSDLQRLAKARKLRELLKKELNKDKVKKNMKNTTSKARVKEYTPDPAKMTMRDLIYYLPVSNPMSSYLADSQPKNENEIVVPPSPARQQSPERAPSPALSSRQVDDDGDDEQEEADDVEADDDQLMVPRVKVAEDGTLIIDEESLTVEVKRAKGPNPADGTDPIFERGSTTTYSSFRKGNYTKPWSTEETEMFFLAISMVGTDFSMICQLFPHRARSQIKHKFKREERDNSWRIDKAFKERRKLDIEFFSKLLDKILEVQKCKKPKSREKKTKSPSEEKKTRKRSKKTKGKKAEKKLSDVEEEEEEEEENGGADMEEVEGEKENEDVSNERGTPASPQKKRKRKKKDDDESTEKPSEKKKKKKKNKKDEEQTNEQVEACLPEAGDAALPEEQSAMDSSGKTETVTAAKSAVIKPAQLSRGRAPKPLVPLGRKWGKKGPTPSTKDPAAGGKSSADDKVDEESSPLRPTEEHKQDKDSSCEGEEEDSTVSPPKPTRYGRLPKPVQHLSYSAKEDALSSASDEPTPESASKKPKRLVKKAAPSKAKTRPKKPQLVTLRASQSEGSDDDDDDNDHHGLSEPEEMDQQHHSSSPHKDSSAPVFVPVGLRSPQPVVSVVEETMEELDISVNVPDVLGISQGALCSDASCERARDNTGTVPCDHQLDLLVDVIDFMSSDHVEVSSDESYNEAAQTLLTIGAVAHHSQLAQTPTSPQSHTAGAPFNSGNESSSHDLEEERATGTETVTLIQSSGSPVAGVPSGPASTEPSQTTDKDVPDTGVIDGGSQIGDRINEEAGEGTHSSQKTNADVEAAPDVEACQEISEQNSPPAKRRRLPKAKPKPNLGRAARFAQSKSNQVEETVTQTQSSATPVAAVPSGPVSTESSQSTDMDEPDKPMESSSVTVPSELSKVSVSTVSDFVPAKPKPNLSRAARFAQSKSIQIKETATEAVTQTQSSAAPVTAVPSGPVSTESSQSTDMNEPDKPMESSSVTVPLELSKISMSAVLDFAPASLAEYTPSTETAFSEETSVSQRNTADVGPGLQMELSTDISEQHSPQNEESFSNVKHKPILGEATREAITKSDSHSPEQTLTSTENSCTAHAQDETITSDVDATDVQDETITSDIAAPDVQDETITSDVAATDVQDETITSDVAATDVQDETITSDIAATDAQDETRTIAATELQVIEKSPVLDSILVQDTSDHPTTVSSIGKLSDSHGDGNEAGFASQNNNSCFSEDKSGILLPQATVDHDKHLESTEDHDKHIESIEYNDTHLESGGSTSCTTSKPHSTENTTAQSEPQPVDNNRQKSPQSTKIIEPNAFELDSALSHSPAEICTSEEKKTDVEHTCQGDSSSGSSKKTVPQQRRTRFPKVKPNIGVPTKTTRSRVQLTEDTNKQSEKGCMDNSSNVSSEKQPVEHLTPPQSSSNTVDHRPESPRAAKSEMLLEKSDTDPEMITESFWVMEEPFTVTGKAPETQNSDKVTSEEPPRKGSTPDERNATEMVSASHLESVAEQDIPQRRGRSTKPVDNTHQKSPQFGKIIEPNPFQLDSAVSHSPAEICTSEEKKTGVERTCQGDSSSDSGSKKTVPQQRRPRFSKVKPNIGVPTRTTRSRLQPTEESNKQSEKGCVDSSSSVSSEKQPVEHLTPPQSSSNTVDHRPEIPRAAKSEMLLEKSDTDPEMITETFWVMEEPFTVTGNAPETQNSDKVTSEEPQRKDSPSDERNATDVVSASHLQSVAEQDSPQRRGRFTKVKPNLRQATRATRSKPQLPVETLTCSESTRLVTGIEMQPTQALDLHSDEQILEDSSKNTSSQQSLSIPEHSGALKEVMLSSPMESNSLTANVLNADDVVVAETSWIIEDPFVGTDYVPENQITDMPTSKPLPTEEPSASQLKMVCTSKHLSTEEPSTSQLKMVRTSKHLSTEEPSTSQQKIKVESFPKRGSRVTRARKGKVVEPEDAATTEIAPPGEADTGEENKVVEELQPFPQGETVSKRTRRGHPTKDKTSVNPRRGTRATRSKPQPTENISTGSEPETVNKALLPTVGTKSTATKQAGSAIMQSSPLRSAQQSERQNQVSQRVTLPESRMSTGEIGGEVMTSPEYTIDSEIAWLIEDPFSISNTEAIELSTKPAASSASPLTEAGSVPQSGFNLRPAKELKPQARTDTATIPEIQSAEDVSTRSERGHTASASGRREPTQISPDPLPWTHSADIILVSDSDQDVRDHTVSQEGLSESRTSEPTTKDSLQDSQHADDASSGTCEREETSTKAPHTRRARLPKPKPCLGTSNRRTRTQLVQHSTQQTPAASSSGEEVAVSHDAVETLEDSKPCPDNQPPVEDATVEEYKHCGPSIRAVCTLASLTQTPVIRSVCTLAGPTQTPVTSAVYTTASPTRTPVISAVCTLASPTQTPVISAVCSLASPTQTPPAVTTHPGGLLEQVPSDNEEPFFILSLTEVPVASTEGDMLLPYLPDSPAQQLQSVGLPSSGDGGHSLTLSDVLVTGETGPDRNLTGVQDVDPRPTACTSSVVQNPENPEGELQLKKSVSRGKKQPSRSSSSAKDSAQTPSSQTHDPTPEPEATCLPAQPQTMEPTAADDTTLTESHVEVEKKDAGDVGDSSSAAELLPDTTSNTLKRPGRKPKGFLSFLSNKSSASPSRQARALSQAPQLSASRTGRRRAAPTAASATTTSHVDQKAPASTAPPNTTQAGKDFKQSFPDSQMDPDPEPSTSQWPDPEPSASQYPDPEPSASQCTGTVNRTANVSLHTQPSAPLQLMSTVDSSHSMLEEHHDFVEDVEEPTSVTQFFLNDIFTDMDEQ